MNRQTVCLDFDGVIHDSPRPDLAIDGTLTAGFWPWAIEAQKHFNLVIYSRRSRTPGGRLAMRRWLKEQWQRSGLPGEMPEFEFAEHKPSPWLTIDDRCICFHGDWGRLTVAELQAFRPWNVKDDKRRA